MVNDFGETVVAMPKTKPIVQPKELSITNINRKTEVLHQKIGLSLNSLFL